MTTSAAGIASHATRAVLRWLTSVKHRSRRHAGRPEMANERCKHRSRRHAGRPETANECETSVVPHLPAGRNTRSDSGLLVRPAGDALWKMAAACGVSTGPVAGQCEQHHDAEANGWQANQSDCLRSVGIADEGDGGA
jgi:hypothetical protein